MSATTARSSLANKAKVAGYQRAYYAANKAKVAESKRAYRAANKAKVAGYQRAYYAANKAKVAESKRAYRAANKAKVAVIDLDAGPRVVARSALKIKKPSNRIDAYLRSRCTTP
jgi:hypothetical protein